MALTDRDIEYLEARAYNTGKADSASGKVPPPTDPMIWAHFTSGLDAADFGEHPSDLDNPTSDDERIAAAIYRRGFHGAPMYDFDEPCGLQHP